MSLRELPAVHRLLGDPRLRPYSDTLGPSRVKAALTAALTDARAAIGRGDAAPSPDAIVAAVCERLRAGESEGLLEVLNGTGVLLHTNLGRAPLGRAAIDAHAAIAGGYSNLEFDLESGTRGSRYSRVAALLRETTGAEDGLVVNNCAAAVLLAIDTFAKGREVLVARGEVVEIGGGFRLPDVLRRGGADLIEVGSTNRTYVGDFERALSPRTALLMRSHTSNYRVEGFTAGVSIGELAQLGKRAGVAVLDDLGSGALVDLATYGLPHEPTVNESVAAGADLVAFSGDKLLGGPQAGILVGRAPFISRLRANPLMRALRVDKGTLAALAATLRAYAGGELAELPLYAMLGTPLEGLRARAATLCAALEGSRVTARAVETYAVTGGGTLPHARLPSIALALRFAGDGADALAARLRRLRPAVVGRIEGDDVLLDLRTLAPAQDVTLKALLLALGR